MSLFNRSLESSLTTAREKRTAAEAKSAALLRDREAALIASDDVAKVDAIDRAIDAERRTASILTDRIAALINEQRAEQRAQLEAAKAASIADARKRLSRRDDAAEKLEAALAAVRSAYAALADADSAIFSEPGRSYLSVTSLPSLNRRDRRATDPTPRLVIGPIRAIVDGIGVGLADVIKEKGVALIETMTAAPIEFENTDDDAEVAA
jgi:hypothetical protein